MVGIKKDIWNLKIHIAGARKGSQDIAFIKAPACWGPQKIRQGGTF
jgi:hypothetical protein